MASFLDPGRPQHSDLVSGVGAPKRAAVTLPLRIEKTLSVPPLIVIGLVLFVLAYCGLPILSTGGSLVDTLLHSQSTVITLVVLMLIVVMVMRARRHGVLNIDASGVDVTIGKNRSLYAWSDIDSVTPIKNALRLDLKGRSAAENRYNLITTRFGVTNDQLATVIREGIARWGGAPASNTGVIGTVSPADRATTTTVWRSFRTLMLMPAIVLAGVFIWMVSSQVSDYMRTVDLRKNGVSANASVVRFYRDLCSRNGCSMNVEYAVAPQAGAFGAGKTFVGHAFLAGHDYEDDPDYQHAKETHTVPVVYDRNDPSISDLNLYNHIFARDPLNTLLLMIGIMGGMMILGLGLFGLIFYVALRRRLSARIQAT
jgi:hypothetical protein